MSLEQSVYYPWCCYSIKLSWQNHFGSCCTFIRAIKFTVIKIVSFGQVTIAYIWGITNECNC